MTNENMLQTNYHTTCKTVQNKHFNHLITGKGLEGGGRGIDRTDSQGINMI